MKLLSGYKLLPIVEGIIDPKTQIQPNGIDFTLCDVSFFVGKRGAVDFDNSRRYISRTKPLFYIRSDGWWLSAGSYWITYNEIVNVPKNVFAFARTRSSMLRCGASVQTGLWDSGYSGRSGSLLVVHNTAGIYLEKNARVIQVCFFELDEPVENLYSGVYQFENM